jgi:hypothetical protein
VRTTFAPSFRSSAAVTFGNVFIDVIPSANAHRVREQCD